MLQGRRTLIDCEDFTATLVEVNELTSIANNFPELQMNDFDFLLILMLQGSSIIIKSADVDLKIYPLSMKVGTQSAVIEFYIKMRHLYIQCIYIKTNMNNIRNKYN